MAVPTAHDDSSHPVLGPLPASYLSISAGYSFSWLDFLSRSRRILRADACLPTFCDCRSPVMFPPSQGLNLDLDAVSGITGSISIACWVVVFSPQIIENFRRGSAEGLSVVFIVVWLLGDVFNIIGAVLQRVLPTMVRKAGSRIFLADNF